MRKIKIEEIIEKRGLENIQMKRIFQEEGRLIRKVINRAGLEIEESPQGSLK